MKAQKILYLNDYSCNEKELRFHLDRNAPLHHMWGVDALDSGGGCSRLIFCRIRQTIKGGGLLCRLNLLYENLRIFLSHFRCKTVFSALPGYEKGFLLANKIGLGHYKVVTVVHHPATKLHFIDQYSKLLFFSPEVRKAFSNPANSEYLFWGPDLEFYARHGSAGQKSGPYEFDFVSAGKVYRDYDLFFRVIPSLTSRFKVFGAGNAVCNEIGYTDLMKFYSAARFICLPVVKFRQEGRILVGLTAFLDAIALGKPILMSDNTLIGIDVEAEGLGLCYKAGDEADFHEKASRLLALDETQYAAMAERCRAFAATHDYRKWSARIAQLLT